MKSMKTIVAAVLLSLSAWFATPVFAEIGAEPLVTVNINDASAAEIAETLKGIGLAKAEAIVAYRQENGSFESVDQLAVVKGVGPATIERNRERIVLQ
ncbi:ComEA family DNA-binding protein [Pseudomonas sp. MYb185]|uniref:ComEA family DNA-binding protein n=1 Tax=Pseudomonas sp. MYb185 TaxID=1848729 RepID=UPI000CFC4DC7|nr:ComEA family DNA-binding protein [Pseudomonas sp. MYb185]PRB82160.1 DNA uptake protein [Pseudomonas sp. MYb185]